MRKKDRKTNQRHSDIQTTCQNLTKTPRPFVGGGPTTLPSNCPCQGLTLTIGWFEWSSSANHLALSLGLVSCMRRPSFSSRDVEVVFYGRKNGQLTWVCLQIRDPMVPPDFNGLSYNVPSKMLRIVVKPIFRFIVSSYKFEEQSGPSRIRPASNAVIHNLLMIAK